MATDNRRSSAYKGRIFYVLRHTQFLRASPALPTYVPVSRCWAYPADTIKPGFQETLAPEFIITANI